LRGGFWRLGTFNRLQQCEVIATRRRFRLLYDGECPICRREVQWLKGRDRAGNLKLENIAALGFDPARYGLSRGEINRELHGIKPDGTIVRGMEAVREAYRSVGLGWIMAPTRLPGVRFLSDRVYGWFARNRRALGRLLTWRSRNGCHNPAGSEISDSRSSGTCGERRHADGDAVRRTLLS